MARTSQAQSEPRRLKQAQFLASPSSNSCPVQGDPALAAISAQDWWRGADQDMPCLVAVPFGGGNPISGDLPAWLASAFSLPASRDIRSENSSQTRRSRADRLSDRPCDRGSRICVLLTP